MNTLSRSFRFIWLLGIAVLAASAVGAGWMLRSPAGDASDTSGAETNGPKRGTEPSVVCFGLVDSEDGLLSLLPTLSGRVVEVAVKEGQAIAVGAVLLKLDDRLARFQVQRAEAALNEAKGSLAKAKSAPAQHASMVAAQQHAIQAKESQLEGARNIRIRAEDLLKGNQAIKEEVYARQAAAKALESEVEAEKEKLRGLGLVDLQSDIVRAQAAVVEKEALWEEAKYGLKELTLLAPVAGTVTRLNVHIGDLASPQMPRPALQLSPKGPRIIRAEVEQEFARRVLEGQSVTVEDDSTSDGKWKGKVTRIADSYSSRRALQEPFQFSDVRTLEIIITLEPDQAPLRLNQRVRGTINVR